MMKTYMIASIIIGALAAPAVHADSTFPTDNNDLIRSCFEIIPPFTANTSTELTENDRMEELSNASKSKLTCCLHGSDFHLGQNNVVVMCENTKK